MKKILLISFLIASIAFEIKAQTLGMSPSQGRRTERLFVKLTGTNYNFSQATNTLEFFKSGTSTASKEVLVYDLFPINANDLRAQIFISASATGNYNYRVTNSNGIAGNVQPFVVGNNTNPARLLSVTPNLVNKTNMLVQLELEGFNTWFLQGSNTQEIKFFYGGSQTSTLSVISQAVLGDNYIIANLSMQPNAPIGKYDIEISNNNEPVFLKDALEVTWPVAVEEVVKAADDIAVYPVPAKEKVTISSTREPIEEAVIMDLSGKEVSKETPAGAPTMELTLTLGDMLQPKQLYLVKIKTASGVRFVKIAGE